jgi:hypothetical protein
MTPLQWLVLKAGTDETPSLDVPEVEAILRRAARPDHDGNSPFSDDWRPTYDLNAAVADALEARAAKVLGRFDITVDGQTLRREQVHKALMQAAAVYRRRSFGMVSKPAQDGRVSFGRTILGR